MSNKNDEGSLSSEVSSRLDELFGEEDPEQKTGAKRAAGIDSGTEDAARLSETESPAEGELDDDSPIKNLKALVFSIDWEITDETMVGFLEEVRRLKAKYKDDKVLGLFLKLHESVGRYIKARKAKAHPDSMSFIASVYKSFEKAVRTPGITEIQKKRMLSAEVKKFKAFKQRVRVREAAMAPVEEAAYEEIRIEKVAPRIPKGAVQQPGISLETQAVLDYIVAEIRKTIKAEFQTLLQIIKNLGA